MPRKRRLRARTKLSPIPRFRKLAENAHPSDHDHVEVGRDYVTISDRRGEAAHWVADEWKEDPSVIKSIENAIRIATRGGSVRQVIEDYNRQYSH